MNFTLKLLVELLQTIKKIIIITCYFQQSPCNTIIEKMDHDFDITFLLNVWNSKDLKMSIYDYTEVSDFDAFILKLLVSTKTDCQIDDQLDLACKWSRLDVAEHVLSSQLDATSGAKYSNGLTKTLFHALLWGHSDFCGILIENGADIYDIQVRICPILVRNSVTLIRNKLLEQCPDKLIKLTTCVTG